MAKKSAGQAFLDLAEKDPEGFRKIKQRWDARAAAWASPEVQEALAEARRAIAESQQEWEAKYDEPYPVGFEDVVELCAAAGIPPAYLLDGKWTYREVFPYIQGYLRKLIEEQKHLHVKPSADKFLSAQKSLPPNPDVLKLCYAYANQTNDNKSLAQIARELTGETAKADSQAKSLAREARNYRHLWGKRGE